MARHRERDDPLTHTSDHTQESAGRLVDLRDTGRGPADGDAATCDRQSFEEALVGVHEVAAEHGLGTARAIEQVHRAGPLRDDGDRVVSRGDGLAEPVARVWAREDEAQGAGGRVEHRDLAAVVLPSELADDDRVAADDEGRAETVPTRPRLELEGRRRSARFGRAGAWEQQQESDQRGWAKRRHHTHSVAITEGRRGLMLQTIPSPDPSVSRENSRRTLGMSIRR